MPKPKPEYLYFIQSTKGGPIKIGRSKQVNKRLKRLTSCSPFPLRVLATTPTPDLEKKLHKKFNSSRSHNEWYHESDGLMSVIEAAKNKVDLCSQMPYLLSQEEIPAHNEKETMKTIATPIADLLDMLFAHKKEDFLNAYSRATTYKVKARQLKISFNVLEPYDPKEIATVLESATWQRGKQLPRRTSGNSNRVDRLKAASRILVRTLADLPPQTKLDVKIIESKVQEYLRVNPNVEDSKTLTSLNETQDDKHGTALMRELSLGLTCLKSIRVLHSSNKNQYNITPQFRKCLNNNMLEKLIVQYHEYDKDRDPSNNKRRRYVAVEKFGLPKMQKLIKQFFSAEDIAEMESRGTPWFNRKPQSTVLAQPITVTPTEPVVSKTAATAMDNNVVSLDAAASLLRQKVDAFVRQGFSREEALTAALAKS